MRRTTILKMMCVCVTCFMLRPAIADGNPNEDSPNLLGGKDPRLSARGQLGVEILRSGKKVQCPYWRLMDMLR